MSAPVIPTEGSILPEELQQIQDVQTRYTSLTRRYGELYFQNKFIAAEMQEIDDEMVNIENQRIEVMTVLQQKYGAGTIDVNTGVFKPLASTE